MNKRSFVRRMFCTKVALLCTLLPGVVTNVTAQSEKPNIVLIVADDLGYGDIEPYGQQKIKTPYLSQLAKEGRKFTQFYAGTSVCAPSRSALITGMHTGHTYIRGNKEIEPEGQYPIPDSAYTLAEALQQAGYSTGLFGKWGLGSMESSGNPLQQGFDRFYGYNCQRQSHRYYPTHLWDNNEKVMLKENGNLMSTVTYAPDLIQGQALQFIEDKKQESFFLMLTYTLPHAELLVPEDSIFQYYKGRFPETPHMGNDYGDGATVPGYCSQEFPRASFAAMVGRLDWYVGQVMAKLHQLGIAENTIVMFTSDNGPHTEGGADPAFFNSSGGYRGVKRDLYEGGIRVPMIVKWPGKIKPGTQTDFPGAFWDIFPTLSELSGAKRPAVSDGISLLPAMQGVKARQKRDYLYWEFHEGGGRQALRKDDWKVVRLNVLHPEKTSVELYNVKKDPGEQNNLADQYPSVTRQLLFFMNQAHRESVVFPLLPQSK